MELMAEMFLFSSGRAVLYFFSGVWAIREGRQQALANSLCLWSECILHCGWGKRGLLGISFWEDVKELPRSESTWNAAKGRAKERKEGF